jgi:hypothetical protein
VREAPVVDLRMTPSRGILGLQPEPRGISRSVSAS